MENFDDMKATQLQSISLVQAQPSEAPSNNPPETANKNGASFNFLLPMLIIFAGFIWISSRRQKKQEQEQRNKIDRVKAGDRILLLGGLYGVVSKINETSVFVEVAHNVVVEYNKSSIIDIILPPTEKTEETAKETK